MDESFTDPAAAPVEAAPDNPTEAPSDPVEQGQVASPAPEADAQDDGGSLRHADYTRKTQELAEQRRAFEAEQQQFAEHKQFLDAIQQDPDLLQQIQQYFEPDNPEPDEFVDPFEQKQSELDQRLAAIEQREQQEHHQRLTEQALTEDLSEITKLNDGAELSPDELELLGHFVRPDQNGIPRINIEAWKKQNALFESRRQQWIAGKTAAPSPPPEAGQPGSEKFDITDRDSRIKRLAAVLSGGSV